MRKRFDLAVFAVCLVLGLTPATSMADDSELAEHVPDQLLVKFEPGTEESVIQAINGQLGGEVKLRFRGDADLRLVALPSGSDLTEAMAYFEAQPEVRFAEPDYIYRTQIIPNDTRFGELWGMHNTGQSGGLVDFDIDAPEAWDQHTESPGIVVGSIDTGVDMNHEDLVGNIWQNMAEVNGVAGTDDDNNGYIDDFNGWDFINNDNNPSDDHGVSHGTHTMGTTSAKGNNATGVAGVVWTSQIMVLKGCSGGGSCPSSATIPAIDYATDNGAWVTSNSWGGGGFSQAMTDAIERANQAGVLFSAAAGNNGRDIEISNFYPAGYDNENIISVAAMNRFGNKAGFSNWGATRVDFGAPGESILSTQRFNSYGTLSGTSMACPHATGAVVSIMGANPTLGHLEYKQILMDSVEPNDAMAGRSLTGGVLNINNALALVPPLEIPDDNLPPTGDAGGPYKGRAWKAVTFDGSGSTDPNAPGGSGVDLGDFVSTYTWDFGDGNQVTTSSPTVTHIYACCNADYVVTLTVKDKYRVAGDPVTTTCRIRGGGRKPKN